MHLALSSNFEQMARSSIRGKKIKIKKLNEILRAKCFA